jgi:hypothetical protein
MTVSIGRRLWTKLLDQLSDYQLKTKRLHHRFGYPKFYTLHLVSLDWAGYCSGNALKLCKGGTRFSAPLPTVLTEDFRGFPQSSPVRNHTSAIGHYYLLPDSSQFTNHDHPSLWFDSVPGTLRCVVWLSLLTFQRCLLPPSADSPDVGGGKHLWNVGKLLPDYTTQHPKRQLSSYMSPWEP